MSKSTRTVMAGTLAAFLSLAGVASADELLLKSGGAIRGTIVDQNDRTVVIRTSAGNLNVPRKKVKTIVLSKGGKLNRNNPENYYENAEEPEREKKHGQAKFAKALFRIENEPPLNTVGQPPASATGQRRSSDSLQSVLSRPIQGNPRIVEVLDGQALELNSFDGVGDQIRLSVTRPVSAVSTSFDLVVIEADTQFTVHWDVPEIRPMRFKADGTILFMGRKIATYKTFNTIHVRMDANLSADTAEVFLNGVSVHKGDFGGATQLRSIRFSTPVFKNPKGVRVHLDKIHVSVTEGTPTPTRKATLKAAHRPTPRRARTRTPRPTPRTVQAPVHKPTPRPRTVAAVQKRLLGTWKANVKLGSKGRFSSTHDFRDGNTHVEAYGYPWKGKFRGGQSLGQWRVVKMLRGGKFQLTLSVNGSDKGPKTSTWWFDDKKLCTRVTGFKDFKETVLIVYELKRD